MKKILKISAIILGSLLLLMAVLPFAFKGKIKAKVQNEINAGLNARVTFGKLGLSMFRHFPDMTLTLKDLYIVGVKEFEKDTLAGLPSLSFTLNLKSVFKGDTYEIKRVILDSPKIRLRVLGDGKVNWDITKPSTDTTTTTSSFKATLNKVTIRDAEFTYDDAETPMFFALYGLSGELSGDMTMDKTTLDVDATVASVVTDYEGIRYVSQAHADLVTQLQADLANWIFTFKGAELDLNAFRLKADGFFAMPDDGYDMDIRFSSSENSLKSFLSLIPAIYARDFESVRTDGTMQFDGFVKGKYTDVLFPSFGINLKIANGMFMYPSLPGKVDEINLVASVKNPDGDLDHTLVEVPKLHLKMLQDPLDMSFTLSTPVSDPEIHGKLKGRINLSDVSRFYPMGNETRLGGIVNADISLDGRMSYLETGKYEQFNARGFADISGVNYSGPQVPQEVKISKARLDFSPAYIAVSNLAVAIGKNDLSADGRIENYLPYLFRKNSTLKGSLTTKSTFMDLNSLIPDTKPTASAPSGALSVVEIPANIDFTLKSNFSKLIYDKYTLTDAGGTVVVRDKTLYLEGIRADMLGGTLGVSGSYATPDANSPKVDLAVKVNSIDVKQSFNTFNTVQSFAPIAQKLNGKLTTNLSFNGKLGSDMMPDLSSISGEGLILSDLLSIDNLNTFNKIADVLKIEKLRKPAIEKVNLSFDLVDGKATVKPMDFKLASYKSNFSGTIGLDQTINFVLNLDIPRSEFGSGANGVLNSLLADAAGKGLKVSLGDVVPVTLLIGGTVTNPKITAGVKQALAGVVDDLKQQAIAQVQQKKEEVVNKAKEEANKLIDEADARASKLLAAAQQQSDQLMKTARISADKLRAQADSTADKVIAEGKKKGVIAEVAAKKAADQIKKEADKKADKLLQEAQAKSDAILNKARAEAEQLRAEARSRTK